MNLKEANKLQNKTIKRIAAIDGKKKIMLDATFDELEKLVGTKLRWNVSYTSGPHYVERLKGRKAVVTRACVFHDGVVHVTVNSYGVRKAERNKVIKPFYWGMHGWVPLSCFKEY